MAEPLVQQATIKYKTYVKQTMVDALRAVFASHADPILRKTKVGIDFNFKKTSYPAVIVRFYERNISNAGVGHLEHIKDPNAVGKYIKYKHYLYQGDIEFAVYALSSYDRDVISDSLIQTLTMASTEPYTNLFLDRIYDPDADPAAQQQGGAYNAPYDHFINLNTDQIQGFGETQTQAPWTPEDVLVYQTSYRINIHGEFYSRTPINTTYGLVERVESYPYNPDAGETKPNPNPTDPAPWITPGPQPL